MYTIQTRTANGSTPWQTEASSPRYRAVYLAERDARRLEPVNEDGLGLEYRVVKAL